MNILRRKIITIIIVILLSNIFALNTFIDVQASEFNLQSAFIETGLPQESIKIICKSNKEYIIRETQKCLREHYYEKFKFYGDKNNFKYNNNEKIWDYKENEKINLSNVDNKFFGHLNNDINLKKYDFDESSFFKESKGKFVFGTVNGVSVFNSEETNKTSYSQDVVLNKFKVNGNIDINENILNFEWYRNMIRIKVSMPEAYNNKNTKYYYKLLNVDKDWEISDECVFVYNNLNPGKYLLKIKAINDNGDINSEKQVEFTVKPQIWRSPGAIALYVILIILIIYLSITKVKDLDRMVEKRTKQLREEMEKNRKLFDKIIDLEKRKNNYFVNLSHELRTPLNVISSTEQLITQLNKQENGIEKEKLDYYMKIIKRNSSRLLKLINNIIDTNKIESGRYELNLEKNDIVYLVEESSLSLKDYIENKGIHLIIDPEVEEKVIMCDSYEIERCIVNLVSNAAKFTPEGGKISVILKEVEDKVVIIVKDNGIGIEPKYHKAIFDRFNQIVDANSETKGGSGLGLTITKHIIDLHKGEIYVNSDIGKGCEFIVILPTNIE